ncbi:MAG: bifunctional (p)ppGpp synthetase/guanosine-3',5'-bis(diphosphate) 3'-pyrophosphohydrolase [Termitinemataceae bacterium]|nr:MAG: bifunctional (p)ppGpp synthetase/guanosine-3',5'-bis(diphosphate) 3'-pyrophosphohydrolase [Termitinemataceae bacterium]
MSALKDSNEIHKDFEKALEAYPQEARNEIFFVMQSIGDNTDRTIGTAAILAFLKLDPQCIKAALLLDIFPIAACGQQDAKNLADKTIYEIAENAHSAIHISTKERTIAEAERIRKMIFAMVKDIRVIYICLAYKLQTMRTLGTSNTVHTGEDKEDMHKLYAQECLTVYAPLANRLGLSRIKDEMEDLCLKHINREAFNHIKDIVALKYSQRQNFLKSVQEQIISEAKKNNIDIQVESRAKHFYSIYQKMRKRQKEAGELYDLFGLRILCGTPETCYTLLGVVHKLWKPVDGRFKDYIAMPKANGYQSLHTTVLAFDTSCITYGGGNMLEIQIRTDDMHRTAEYGFASHWLYKKGKSSEVVKNDDLPIVNTLMQIVESSIANEATILLDEIKKEILKDSIYVWTPQGKVIELPQGAVPIDFAYSIHSEVGDHCLLSKANGIIIPLHSELQNTQIVEIVTSQNAHPNSNWLQIAKTSKARSKIRAYLALAESESTKNTAKKKTEEKTSGKQNEQVPENDSAFNRTTNQITTLRRSINPLRVRVEEEKNLLSRFAKCCNPILGDPIIGYVSRTRGIIIHRRSCKSILHIKDFAERSIETEWEHTDEQITRIKVESKHCDDFFSEIDSTIKKSGGTLIEGRTEERDGITTGFFTLHVENACAVKKLLKGIRTLPNVLNIRVLEL